jgi:hypothetical protein
LGKIANNPATKRLTEILFLLLPDLSRTNLKNLAVYGDLPPPSDLVLSAIYTLSYTLLVLAITIVIWGKKEF